MPLSNNPKLIRIAIDIQGFCIGDNHFTYVYTTKMVTNNGQKCFNKKCFKWKTNPTIQKSQNQNQRSQNNNNTKKKSTHFKNSTKYTKMNKSQIMENAPKYTLYHKMKSENYFFIKCRTRAQHNEYEKRKKIN